MLRLEQKRNRNAKLCEQFGQGLVEYALILLLIAIVVIAAVKSVGESTSSAFNTFNANIGAASN